MLFRSKVNFRMGSPIEIDHENKSIKLDNGESLEFDYLIVALGSITNDFNVPGVRENSLGMKSISEALKIRSDIMRHFEELCSTPNPEIFYISVIGGGPTGVEMAGALAELVRGPLSSDNQGAASLIKIRIIEAGDRLLPAFSTKLSLKTAEDLQKLGVEVLTNTQVMQLSPTVISIANNEQLISGLNIWTAGVKAESSMEKLGLPNEFGRISVNESLQVEDRKSTRLNSSH